MRAPAYSATLGPDTGGRISPQTDVLVGATTTDVYGYDAAGRLETVTRNGTLVVTFGYDANGNRNAVTTAGGTTSATFDDQDRILTFGTRTYTHTPHGDVGGWTDSATSTTTTLERRALDGTRMGSRCMLGVWRARTSTSTRRPVPRSCGATG